MSSCGSALTIRMVSASSCSRAASRETPSARRATTCQLWAVRLVDGVARHRDEIDRLLSQAARNWDLDRMAAVDRNALRLGVYELLWEDEVPMKVAINEAIELGKRYSTEASGAFINGILDRIRRDQGL